MEPIDGRYKHLGTILRKKRLKKGLKQRELAERIGYQQAFVARVEKGARPLTIGQFLDICQHLNTNPANVIRRVVRGD